MLSTLKRTAEPEMDSGGDILTGFGCRYWLEWLLEALIMQMSVKLMMH